MKNSPTLSQKYVDMAIQPTRKQNPEAYITHYMGDILIATPKKEGAGCLLLSIRGSN